MKFNTWGLGIALTLFGAGTALATSFDDVTEFEARLEQLQGDFRQEQIKRMQAYRAAESGLEKQEALAFDPWKALDPVARQLAKDAAGTEVAAQSWGMIFTNFDQRAGDKDELWKVFTILVSDYADSPALISVVANVQYAGRGEAPAIPGLRLLAQTTSSGRTKAASYMSLAKLLERDEATREEAFGFYRLIVKDFSEYKNTYGDTFASLAEASLFESENLQVGLPVPDFSSIDETGAAFSVSDYKGKVVLLDFWGYW